MVSSLRSRFGFAANTIWNAQVSNNLASFGSEEIVPFMVQAPSSVSGNTSGILSLDNFSIYPNPSHGKISLDLSSLGEYSGDLRVSVISMLGQVLIVRTIQWDDKHLNLDMHQYPAGSYIVRLQYRDTKVSKRCVVE